MQMKLFGFLTILLTLPLAACQSSEDIASVTSAVPVAHTITADAAGPISPQTPYSSAALGKLFPEGRLETITVADESGVVAALTVFEGGLQVFQVLPASDGSTIRTVHGSGLAVAGPGGERLGDSFAQTGVSRSDCTVGTGAWAGMAICASRQAPNVRFVFDNGGWDGSGSELPPQNFLAKGKLQRIVWVPQHAS